MTPGLGDGEAVVGVESMASGRGCSHHGTRLHGLNALGFASPSFTSCPKDWDTPTGPLGPLPSNGAVGSSFFPEKTQIELALSRASRRLAIARGPHPHSRVPRPVTNRSTARAGTSQDGLVIRCLGGNGRLRAEQVLLQNFPPPRLSAYACTKNADPQCHTRPSNAGHDGTRHGIRGYRSRERCPCAAYGRQRRLRRTEHRSASSRAA